MKAKSEVESIRPVDGGLVHTKLMSRAQANYRDIEAASLKVTSELCSPEAKRMLLRYYPSVQRNVQWISGVARRRLGDEHIRQVEDLLRARLNMLDQVLDGSIQGGQALLKKNGVTEQARFHVTPLQTQVLIKSAIARRYVEAINKLDHFLPTLETLVILEVIDDRHANVKRTELKKAFRSVFTTARESECQLRALIRKLNRIDCSPAVDGYAAIAAKNIPP